MQDFEKLGVFYLGKAYDLGKKKRKGVLSSTIRGTSSRTRFAWE